MSEVKEPICQILRRRFHCLCGRPPYCVCVCDLVNLVLEQCEEETEDEQ